MRRGDLQKDVAENVGVCAETILHWELNQTEISIRCCPKVVAYLGFCPLPGDYFDLDLGGLARVHQLHRRLTPKEAAAAIGVDPGSLSRWVKGLQTPGQNKARNLLRFLRT